MSPAAHEPAVAWKLLALLAAANVLNFVDRQLPAALAPLVMDELGLTRTQVGLLVGFAFVALFSAAGIALGALADRTSRTRLIAVGLLVWSVMTAASGAAQGFGHLAAARVFVGVGEATLIPAAVSLLADVFPAARLGLAAAIFTSATPVGQALSYLAAGVIAPHLGWRGCFFLAGGAGLLLAVPLLAVAEPPRRGLPQGSAPLRLREVGVEVAKTLASVPSAPLAILGIVAFAFTTGAALHTVTWLVQERGFTPPRAAALTGLMTAVAGSLGNLAVGALADWRERRAPGGRAATLAGLAPVLAIASYAFYTLPPTSAAFPAAWAVTTAGLLGWLGAALAAYQGLFPPHVRASAVALAILCLNLVGIGPGALATGWLGDTASLTVGLKASSAVALAAGVPLALAARHWGRVSDRSRNR